MCVCVRKSPQFAHICWIPGCSCGAQHTTYQWCGCSSDSLGAVTQASTVYHRWYLASRCRWWPAVSDRSSHSSHLHHAASHLSHFQANFSWSPVPDQRTLESASQDGLRQETEEKVREPRRYDRQQVPRARSSHQEVRHGPRHPPRLVVQTGK